MLLGFPSDVAGFALLQLILAQKLGVKPGVYSHSISNAHLYDNQYEAAETLIKRPNSHKPIHLTLPKNAFDRAEKKDTTLFDEISADALAQYKPQDAIKGLQVIL